MEWRKAGQVEKNVKTLRDVRHIATMYDVELYAIMKNLSWISEFSQCHNRVMRGSYLRPILDLSS